MRQRRNALLATGTKNVSFPADYTFEMWLEDLRGIVWNCHNKKAMSFGDMAVAANLSKATVENFAYGDTKRPSSNTIFQLARVVGIRIVPIDLFAPVQPNEVQSGTYKNEIKRK